MREADGDEEGMGSPTDGAPFYLLPCLFSHLYLINFFSASIKFHLEANWYQRAPLSSSHIVSPRGTLSSLISPLRMRSAAHLCPRVVAATMSCTIVQARASDRCAFHGGVVRIFTPGLLSLRVPLCGPERS